MKTYRQELALRVSVAALRAALAGLALMQTAHAQDASVAELTTPAKTVEIGAGYVSRDSFKFGEYNGLEEKGAYGIGNLDLRGGGRYDSNDSSRWRLSGHNLGLESRDARAEYGWQGLFRLNLGYDELLHNGNDTYRTPYQGIGGSTLVLPGNWITPTYATSATMATGNAYPALSATMLGLSATGYNSPLVANTAYICRSTTNGCAANPTLGGIFTTGFPVTAADTAALGQNAVDLSDFQTVALSTKRRKFDLGASYYVGASMQIDVSMRREKKDGLKQLGVVNSGNGGLATENAVIIPKLIDTITDQYNASFSFTGKTGFLTLAYYGSVFTNDVKAMTVGNPYGIGPTAAQNAFGISSATISEEPDNTLHQFRLTGGYDLMARTRAVFDASYSRNTQNDAYALDPAMFATPSGAAAPAANNASYSPASSAHARVINKAFDFKLTARPLDRLGVMAGYKYDNRENQTPVNTYVWYDVGAKNFGPASGAAASALNGATVPGVPGSLPLYSGVNIVANRPYSKSLNQIDLDAEFGIMPGHALKLGAQWQSIDRYCEGTWIDCSFADRTRETTLTSEYRFTAGESVSGRFGMDQADRSVDYNNNAWMSLAPSLGATNIATLVAQGYNGSVAGFLNTYGLSANGLPIAANATNPITAIASSAQLTAIYNLLFGNGNGSLNSSYYGNRNTTNNWAGLDVFNMSNRTRSRLRGAVDWQTTETLGWQTSFDYRRDDYPSNSFGLENGVGWSVNLDGAFTPSEDLAIDAYYTHEDQRTRTGGDSASNGTVSRNAAAGTAYAVTGAVPAQTGTNTTVAGLCPGASTAGLTAPTQFQVYNNNLKIDPCAAWNANLRDRTETVGLSFNKKRLLSRRFSLSGDLSWSRSVTSNEMTGGFYYTNTVAPFAANVPAVYYIHAADLPAVTTSTARLGLSGRYQLSKAGAVRLSYSVSWLHVDDYVYQTTQPAGTSGTVMPTQEQSPSYVVHVIGISYAYSFQ
jgi:hypothetical protein